MRIYKFQGFLSVGLFLVYFFIVVHCDLVNSTNSIKKPHKASYFLNHNSKHSCGLKCLRKTKVRKMVESAHSTQTKDFTSEVLKTHSTSKQTLAEATTSSRPLQKQKQSNFSNSSRVDDIEKLVRDKKKKCKTEKNISFTCQKLQWFRWLVNTLDKNSTAINSYVELVWSNSSHHFENNELLPENRVETFLYRVIRNWGDPLDEFMFRKVKQYTKSLELKAKVPYIGEIQVSPRSHQLVEGRQARTFWDPGFNLKMKLPFFRDELKFAVSTGPSFIAGLGVGFIFLAIKSLFGPFILGMKYMVYNIFFKDASPYDLMKMMGFGGNDHVDVMPPSGENYEPPHVNNPFDNLHSLHDKYAHLGGGGGPTGGGGPPNPGGYPPPPGASGPAAHSFFGGLLDQGNQYSQIAPIIQQLKNRNPNSQFSLGNLEEGRRQPFPSPTPTAPSDYGFSSTGPSGGSSLQAAGTQNSAQVKQPPDTSFQYIPSAALQLEVENYDPFYSPLLSRIDSIFMHLGFTEEGCRERAVCSIYKFPVKYAPYSNLLSAQLSKHQSELKRPVSSSLKILRYFKYMKAAKDGQGNQNCIEMYPKCESDTEKISSLPMVKTFNQLTELMGGSENVEA